MRYFDFHHHHRNISYGIYNLKLYETAPSHYFSAGIHPVFPGETAEKEWSWLYKSAANPNCLAIGECGLDAFSQRSEEEQERLLVRQIELANELRKPLIIHCVRRFPTLVALSKKAEVPLVVHGFNKKETVGRLLYENDFYLSFGKSLLHNVNLQEFARQFPLERTFLETDAADFDLKQLYILLADLKAMSLPQLQNKIAENLKIFNIDLNE